MRDTVWKAAALKYFTGTHTTQYANTGPVVGVMDEKSHERLYNFEGFDTVMLLACLRVSCMCMWRNTSGTCECAINPKLELPHATRQLIHLTIEYDADVLVRAAQVQNNFC